MGDPVQMTNAPTPSPHRGLYRRPRPREGGETLIHRASGLEDLATQLRGRRPDQRVEPPAGQTHRAMFHDRRGRHLRRGHPHQRRDRGARRRLRRLPAAAGPVPRQVHAQGRRRPPEGRPERAPSSTRTRASSHGTSAHTPCTCAPTPTPRPRRSPSTATSSTPSSSASPTSKVRRRVWHEHPRTYTAALTAAQNACSGQLMPALQDPGSSRTTSSANLPELGALGTVGAIDGAAGPSRQVGQLGGKQCWECGRTGHIQRYCPNPRNSGRGGRNGPKGNFGGPRGGRGGPRGRGWARTLRGRRPRRPQRP